VLHTTVFINVPDSYLNAEENEPIEKEEVQVEAPLPVAIAVAT
jgi:hypothetical protein